MTLNLNISKVHIKYKRTTWTYIIIMFRLEFKGLIRNQFCHISAFLLALKTSEDRNFSCVFMGQKTHHCAKMG